jgi:signal transduction histidine kinase
MIMTNQDLSLPAWCEQLGHHHTFYMAVIDAGMHLSFVNSHFYLAFQQITMPGRGRLFGSLVDDQDLERFDNALKERLGAAGETAVRLRMKHGPGKWVQWHLRPLDEKNGSSGKLLCLGYDLPKEEPAPLSKEADSRAIRQKKPAESILRAQHEERARIGRELHDNINQILTSAHLYLSCLQRDSEDFDFVKGKAAEIILHAVEEVRNLSREMVLPDFRDKGLIRSIDELITELRYGSQLEIGFRHADLLTIESQDQQLKLNLFRIVQAQIRNIVKHSRAKQVEIGLHASNEQVRLVIRDNGIGFDPATTKPGLGLGGIYERAAAYGGKVILDATPGKGCSLIVTIPLELKRIN